jgi:transcription elongation factor GreA
MFNPITPEGYEIFKKTLRKLMETDRQVNINEISDALAMGDLSENAEYHAAKSHQRKIESRISHIKNILDNSIIVDCKDHASKGTVTFGCTVIIYDHSTQEVRTFKLLNEAEVILFKGGVSISSPLGQKMVGLSANTRFFLKDQEFFIQGIEYI